VDGVTCRLGQIVINGTIHNASITASGVASVYLDGLLGYATVNLAGVANVYISADSGLPPPPPPTLHGS
jgi:hypothetical protein